MIDAYSDYIRGLAYKSWARYRRYYPVDPEDFEQSGYLVLLKALAKVDWESMTTAQIDRFIKGKIWFGMINFIRSMDVSMTTQWKHYGNSVSVDSIQAMEEAGAPPPEECVPVLELLDLAGRINLRKNPRDRWVLLMSVMGYTSVEISSMLGGALTPSRIVQIVSGSGLYAYHGVGKDRRRSGLL